jgi:hypothetical protein
VKAMVDLNNDYNTLEKILRQLLARQNRVLIVKKYQFKPGDTRVAYGFYAPKRFGWVHLKKGLGCLRVGVYEKFAKQAEVNHDGFKTETTANNEPGYHWEIRAGESVFLQKVAGYLAEVCRVRH